MTILSAYIYKKKKKTGVKVSEQVRNDECNVTEYGTVATIEWNEMNIENQSECMNLESHKLLVSDYARSIAINDKYSTRF